MKPKREIAARCSMCDRIVYYDEGPLALQLLDNPGICRNCAEAVMEEDRMEMQYDGVGNGNQE